jgi:hypothetical protein
MQQRRRRNCWWVSYDSCWSICWSAFFSLPIIRKNILDDNHFLY